MGLELGRQPARHEEAVENLQQSLAAFRQMGFPVREVEMLLDLGQVHLWAGHHDEAFAAARQALSLAESIDDRFHEADAHNVLAEILQATGRDDDALASFRTALNLARRRGQRDLQARALRGMAAIAEAAGRTAQAREHLVEVLALYTALNMPQAADVRARIAAVDERLAGQPGG